MRRHTRLHTLFLAFLALGALCVAAPRSAQANLLQNPNLDAGSQGYTVSNPGADNFYCCFAVHIGAGSISQTFATNANDLYSLTGYFLSGVASLTVGSLSTTLSTPGPFSYFFTATGNSSTLTFAATDANGFDLNGGLDVEPAPAPTVGGGAASLLAGLGLIGWTVARRRTNAARPA